MDGFLNAMDPNRNGVANAFNPETNGVKNWWEGSFNKESINQQNTVLKGMFSTNKNDKEQGKIAMEAGLNGAADSGIYDHPVGKPNKYDPVYNPDPRLPDAPKNGNNGKTPSSTSTYIYIGGALVLLFVLFKK